MWSLFCFPTLETKNPRSTELLSSTVPTIESCGPGYVWIWGHHYIVCVDHWSGYALHQRMSTTASLAVLKALTNWFNTLDWPNVIRTDGGPQFWSEFVQFCKHNNIVHELSSPYYPCANGLAESGDRIVKNLLKQCMGETGCFMSGGNCLRQMDFFLLNCYSDSARTCCCPSHLQPSCQ